MSWLLPAANFVLPTLARLEALNKELGTTICIGPSAAAASATRLRSLGAVDVRGVGRLEIHTPACM